MAQHAFSSLAALAALAFLVMALMGCASSEQPQHNALYKGNGIAEFHEAHIGEDALRERLPSE
jgi:hypothetical protein